MQKQPQTAKPQGNTGQQIEQPSNRTARAVLLKSEAVPEHLRPCWKVAVKASGLMEGKAALFGGTRKKLEASLVRAGLSVSGVSELEGLGLIKFVTISGRPSPSYLFVSLCFPESFPDSYTAEQRRIALDLIHKHASELGEEEHTVAVYAVACSFAILGGQLRIDLKLLRILLENYCDYSTKIDAILESWQRDRVVKKLMDADYLHMFDYNYLVGDWGQE